MLGSLLDMLTFSSSETRSCILARLVGHAWKTLPIIPVTTIYGLTATFASLIVLAYLTIYMSHLLATIALERKHLENIPKPLGKLIL